MLIRKVLTLIDGKINLYKTRDIMHLVRRTYTDELILIYGQEVLRLHSPILEGTARVKIKGSGRLIV